MPVPSPRTSSRGRERQCSARRWCWAGRRLCSVASARRTAAGGGTRVSRRSHAQPRRHRHRRAHGSVCCAVQLLPGCSRARDWRGRRVRRAACPCQIRRLCEFWKTGARVVGLHCCRPRRIPDAATATARVPRPIQHTSTCVRAPGHRVGCRKPGTLLLAACVGRICRSAVHASTARSQGHSDTILQAGCDHPRPPFLATCFTARESRGWCP